MISAEELRELLDYDLDTGIFTRKARTSTRVNVGDLAGHPDKDGYLRLSLNGKRYKSHRLAWLYVHGEWPEGEIDHINGIRTDNRASNLRVVSRSENMKNTALPVTNTSGFLGVTWLKDRKKWLAQIMVNGKCKNLGRFSDLNKAVIARKEAEIKYGFHENHGRNS